MQNELQGMEGQGWARHGLDGHGADRQGKAWQGAARIGSARLGWAWRGEAWIGEAWIGKARQSPQFCGKKARCNMRVQLTMRGTSPLVMHNVALADPTNSVTKAIAVITDKGSRMSDDDRLEVARLEFHGGLYLGRGGPVIPSPNILRTIANAAKIRRLGKDVERAMIPTALEFPLIYKGPRDAAALWENEAFRYGAPVRIGRGVVSRMRPRFPDWQVVSEWELMTEILNVRDFSAIVEVAGIIEGMGDNRRNGYGRFTSEITELKTTSRVRVAADNGKEAELQ